MWHKLMPCCCRADVMLLPCWALLMPCWCCADAVLMQCWCCADAVLMPCQVHADDVPSDWRQHQHAKSQVKVSCQSPKSLPCNLFTRSLLHHSVILLCTFQKPPFTPLPSYPQPKTYWYHYKLETFGRFKVKVSSQCLQSKSSVQVSTLYPLHSVIITPFCCVVVYILKTLF